MTLSRRLFLGTTVAFAMLAALASGVLAQEPSTPEMMATANRQYERGEYSEAVQQYEALIALGYRDVALYFNLGNAYLQRGDLGRSILNYLRAEELSPRDPDIVANLELARSRTVDQLQGRGRLPCRQRVRPRSALGLRRRVRHSCAAAVGNHRNRRCCGYPPAGHTGKGGSSGRSGRLFRRHAGHAGPAAEHTPLQPL